jgi:hypothetical protein
MPAILSFTCPWVFQRATAQLVHCNGCGRLAVVEGGSTVEGLSILGDHDHVGGMNDDLMTYAILCINCCM